MKIFFSTINHCISDWHWILGNPVYIFNIEKKSITDKNKFLKISNSCPINLKLKPLFMLFFARRFAFFPGTMSVHRQQVILLFVLHQITSKLMEINRVRMTDNVDKVIVVKRVDNVWLFYVSSYRALLFLLIIIGLQDIIKKHW